MEGGDSFNDWEEVVSQLSSDSDPVDSRSFEEIQEHSEGMIRLDHFSLDKGGGVFGGFYSSKSEEGSGVESDNPSWIDPGNEASHFLGRNSGEFWSDSGSERSEDRKVGGFEAKGEVGVGEVVGIEGKDGKVGAFEESFSKLGGKTQVGLERFEGVHGKVDDSVKFWSDSVGDGEDLGEGEGGNGAGDGSLAVVAAAGEEAKSGGESKGMVWWKMPFEMIKYCLFRVSPVWSFSMAAAVLGFVFLGRRLYKMKRRAQSLQLKVAVDDKPVKKLVLENINEWLKLYKIPREDLHWFTAYLPHKRSQAMSRAAKLNEAFSVVRRVPIIRPLLPTAVVNPWPVMTLR